MFSEADGAAVACSDLTVGWGGCITRVLFSVVANSKTLDFWKTFLGQVSAHW